MDSQLSLRERIRQKQNGINNVRPVLIEDDDNDDDDSDIDDNITIIECAEIINNKKKQSHTSTFTKVRLKPDKSAVGHLDLKDIVQKNIDTKTQQTTVTNIENVDLDGAGVFQALRKHHYDIDVESNNKKIEKKIEIDLNRSATRVEKSYTNQAVIDADICGKVSRDSKIVVSTNCLTDDSIKTLPVIRRKRPKLTAEEKQAIKKQKDREKLEKQKLKEKQKFEKIMEKELERTKKKAATLNNRNERKDECFERLLLIVDSCIVRESGGADILKALQDINMRYEVKELPVQCCIGFMRENVDYNVNEKSELTKSSHYVEENHVIHKISATELAIRVKAQIDSNVNKEETLKELVNQLKRKFPQKIVTLVITGTNAYHRFVKTKNNEKLRQQALGESGKSKRKKKTDNVPLLTKQEVEEVLVELQLTTNLSVRFCEDMHVMSSFVASFAKAVAEAPFKKSNESSLGFCSSAPSDKMSVKVANDGHGVLQLWNQQLQQFYGVRTDTATAITNLYPTPLSLMKAYQGLSPSEGENLLQDIEVRRGVGVLQTRRRVGPELSKRLYKLLTSLDGEEPLGK